MGCGSNDLHAAVVGAVVWPRALRQGQEQQAGSE